MSILRHQETSRSELIRLFFSDLSVVPWAAIHMTVKYEMGQFVVLNQSSISSAVPSVGFRTCRGCLTQRLWSNSYLLREVLLLRATRGVDE